MSKWPQLQVQRRSAGVMGGALMVGRSESGYDVGAMHSRWARSVESRDTAIAATLVNEQRSEISRQAAGKR